MQLVSRGRVIKANLNFLSHIKRKQETLETVRRVNVNVHKVIVLITTLMCLFHF